ETLLCIQSRIQSMCHGLSVTSKQMLFASAYTSAAYSTSMRTTATNPVIGQAVYRLKYMVIGIYDL
ncbi:hypothetical protein L6232_25850, partial [Shewanella sp. C31]|nr:hypothetical protein [Shewanella electrica]